MTELILTDEEIGNALQPVCEEEATFYCSDTTVISCINCRPVAQAQLKKIMDARLDRPEQREEIENLLHKLRLEVIVTSEARRWEANRELNQKYSDLILALFPGDEREQESKLVERVIKLALEAIADEEEYEGDMPDDVWDAIHGERENVVAAMRATVILTKEGITESFLEALKGGPDG